MRVAALTHAALVANRYTREDPDDVWKTLLALNPPHWGVDLPIVCARIPTAAPGPALYERRPATLRSCDNDTTFLALHLRLLGVAVADR